MFGIIPVSNTTDGSGNGALSTAQIVALSVYGAILWFIAAMMVRVIGPMGSLDGIRRIVIYALVVPGTVPVIFIAQALAKLRNDQIAIGITIVTAMALLLDGVAFAWFPMLYGPDPALHLAGAAVILWGAGVGLVLAMVMNRRG